MKIIFLSPNGQLNGPRRRIHNFSIHLANKKNDVYVYCKSFYHSSNYRKNNNLIKIEKELIENVTVYWVPSISYSTNGLKRLLSEFQFVLLSFLHIILFRRSADILIADSVTPINGFFGLLVSKISGIKFVHQIRDVWPISLVYDRSIKKKSVSYKILKFMEVIQYKYCDWICSALPNVHSHISLNRGDSSKITYIRNGINLQNFEYSKYTPNKIVNVMYVGTISNAHDVISLLIASKNLKDNGHEKKFNFHIYGDGVKRKECETYCKINELQNVIFYGSVPRDKVATILQKADILVSPVLNSKAYSFGLNLNKNYDYFAAGRAVILSSPTEVNEVTLANAGYSCPAENPQSIFNALLNFQSLSDEDKKKYADNARNYAVKEFDFKILSVKFERMLLDLCKKSAHEIKSKY